MLYLAVHAFSSFFLYMLLYPMEVKRLKCAMLGALIVHTFQYINNNDADQTELYTCAS